MNTMCQIKPGTPSPETKVPSPETLKGFVRVWGALFGEGGSPRNPKPKIRNPYSRHPKPEPWNSAPQAGVCWCPCVTPVPPLQALTSQWLKRYVPAVSSKQCDPAFLLSLFEITDLVTLGSFPLRS